MSLLLWKPTIALCPEPVHPPKYVITKQHFDLRYTHLYFNASILSIFSSTSKNTLFLQSLSVRLLSSPLRITNTTVDHNYFVQQSPWEAYRLSAEKKYYLPFWNLLCLLRLPLDSVMCRKMQSIY